MNKTLRTAVIAAWMGMSGVGKVAKADAMDSKPQLTVCVRNYAQIPSGIMSKAERIAREIFELAGIETTWMNVVIEKQNVPPSQTAQSSCDISTPLVNVMITTREMAAVYGLPSKVLGLAPGKSEEHNRTVVFVFDHIADELVRMQNIADKSYIVGHAMAHEIGHILIHMEQHSHAGIMQANWKEAEFHAMVTGQLSFETDQAARIQTEVTRRSQQQASIQMASLQ